MANPGPPKLSDLEKKPGPPRLSDLEKSKPEGKRVQVNDDGTTSVDITEAVEAGKKLFSALGKGAALAATESRKAAAAAREKVDTVKRERAEKRDQAVVRPVVPVAPQEKNDTPKTVRSDTASFNVSKRSVLIAGIALVLALATGLAWWLWPQKEVPAKPVADTPTQAPAVPVAPAPTIPVPTDTPPATLPEPEPIQPQQEPLVMPSMPAIPPAGYEPPPPEKTKPVEPEPAPVPTQAAAPVQAPQETPAPRVQRKPKPAPAPKQDKDIDDANRALDDYFKQN